MSLKARFAPSPTGQVHIGNIRTAIFNYLFTRHSKGEFLLRIEDTDLERSTKQAIDALFSCMQWLGMDYDGVPMYQTSQSGHHLEVAKLLEEKGLAYKQDASQEKSPLYFRLDYFCDAFPFVKEVGAAEIVLDENSPLSLSRSGLLYFTISAKGKSVENAGCLAGFKDLKVLDKEGKELFALTSENVKEIWDRIDPLTIEGGAKLLFTRREVFFEDMVKGHLAKPLDSIKDLVIVRSDGSPVFHLANVCDDITQSVSHIVRGDDHVENTFRHLFLFQALGAQIPTYAHLPMIVNASGKPYSKRDGDAFVGDFKEKGFLPQALFNYLALLGWSPGDNREKMSMEEMIEAFHIERAQRTPAQFDIMKLTNMNGHYIAEMPFAEFEETIWDFAERFPYRANADRSLFRKVAELMQSRTKLFTDCGAWNYFFERPVQYDAKGMKKFMGTPEQRSALNEIREAFGSWSGPEDLEAIDAVIRKAEEKASIGHGKLNQSVRIAVTGTTVGAGICETLALLGLSEVSQRIASALAVEMPA